MVERRLDDLDDGVTLDGTTLETPEKNQFFSLQLADSRSKARSRQPASIRKY